MDQLGSETLEYFRCFRFEISQQILTHASKIIHDDMLVNPLKPKEIPQIMKQKYFCFYHYYFITDIREYNEFWSNKYKSLAIEIDELKKSLKDSSEIEVEFVEFLHSISDIEKAWYISLEILELKKAIYNIGRHDSTKQILEFKVKLKHTCKEILNPFFITFIDFTALRMRDLGEKTALISNAIISHWTKEIKFAFTLDMSTITPQILSHYITLNSLDKSDINVMPYPSGFLNHISVKYIYKPPIKKLVTYFISSDQNRLAYDLDFLKDRDGTKQYEIDWFNKIVLFKLEDLDSTSSSRNDAKEIEEDFERLSDADFYNFMFKSKP